LRTVLVLLAVLLPVRGVWNIPRKQKHASL
jgi:hypothetical protein